MTDLVDRYVHQVGRYLSPKQRADIEAELRSQIRDQLEDRYCGMPSDDEVAAVLRELGDPRVLAARYAEDRYLVGPAFYPTMITVLQYGWVVLPPVVFFLSIFGALTAAAPVDVPRALLDAGLSAVQAGVFLSAAVVQVFAMIERAAHAPRLPPAPFDPVALPRIDDPAAVSRFEFAFGIALGVIVTLMLVYFLAVGGLTLQFNLSDPGDVIPFPTVWGVLLLLNGIAMIALHLVVLRRNRWDYRLWALETALEVFGSICLYFVLTTPLFDRLVAANRASRRRPCSTPCPNSSSSSAPSAR
ncbi:MAG: hypothetical protein IPM16_14875 [Chloroflexi bacterium]|nr:hypothetical protein [Chloroflexota bacterium]